MLPAMKWKLLSALLLSVAVSGPGCAAELGEDEDGISSTGEEDEEETTREGDETVSADELKLGDARTDGFGEPTYSAAEKAEVLAQYRHIDPNKIVPETLLENALQYWHHNKAKIENKGWMTIIDMGMHSGKKRFFLIGMDSGNVTPTVVAHGSGSDPDNDGKATKFADTIDSHKTSIGYYLTAETYTGQHGFSLKLDGLSASNKSARARAVVMHGASYVSPGKSKQGRSWGCPAVANNEKDGLIQKLRGGSLLYIDTTAGAESR